MLRFLLDEDLSHRVAEGLRDRGVDAISVHEVRRWAMSDEEQRTFATEQGRVLVTYNRADFQQLDAQWRLLDRPHAGILWCSELSLPRRSFGALVAALEDVAARYDSLEGLCIPLTRQQD